ncbi:host attachment protein [Caulobacter sp. KR2-114]|uniref:host attachment protein n=1 Tax=Caulobacter sp. KR2-114 TaxID=3400912 RepID=UPI003C06F7BC
MARFLFVITDGGHARLVERSSETGDFITVEKLENHSARKGPPYAGRGGAPTETMGGPDGHRHAVAREDQARAGKEAFVSQVAERVTSLARSRALDGVVLAAPKRLVGQLRDGLGKDVHVVDVLGKDLTKVRDHDLGEWFGGLNYSRIAQV